MNRILWVASTWSLRLALASAFLSASVDRLGWWGPPGAPGVAWGEWPAFIAYTGRLLWFLPESWVGLFGAVATAAEILLAVWLVMGFRLKLAALASAALLLSFAGTMTLALGVKEPLNYSVFTAFAAALGLACLVDLGPGARRNPECAALLSTGC